jgi:hypothetical protein
MTVTLSGSQSVTTSTDSDGNYIFTSLPTSGSYVVTPASDDYDFDSATFITPGGDQTANFITKPKTYLVKGTIRSDGNPLPGVVVALSGSSLGTTITDSAGGYSYKLLKGESYVLTPAKANYTFGPVSASINALAANAQIDFTATIRKHSIAGRVLNQAGAPVAGVVVTLAGPESSTTTTASDGSYSFSNLDAGTNWTVTAVKENFALSPAVQTFIDLATDTVANFEAVQLPVLMTEAGTDRAVAMELTQWVPEPFSITTTLLAEGHNRTRIIVFATDLGLLPGEGVEALTAEVEDSDHVLYPLGVEFVSPLQGLPNINQVVVRLTGDLNGAGDVLLSLKVHGLTSNKARIVVGPVIDDPN